jgi:hypothetical protein
MGEVASKWFVIFDDGGDQVHHVEVDDGVDLDGDVCLSDTPAG